MRILQVNKFYYPRGGADQYFLDLTAMQVVAGHEVAVFAMHHPKNLETPWSSYFVSHLSFNKMSWRDKWRVPGRVLYSLEAKNKFLRLLNDFKPDIIHCHNIYHHLSPSILDVARQKNIPVIMHLHDYKLIAANHAMYAPGPVPHHCQPDNYYACLKRACVKDSLSATILAGLEMYLHHKIFKIYQRSVDVFIAPSAFMKETVVRYGWSPEKIRVIYNYFRSLSAPGLEIKNNQATSSKSTDDYLLYFGRLSPEKGIDDLLKATALSGHKLKIAGRGELEDYLKALAMKLKAPVEFLGFKDKQELYNLIMAARAIVMPSVWGENMPLSLLEAMGLSKVVIASKTGGLPEMIIDKETGLLFQPGNVNDLVLKIKELDKIDIPTLAAKAKLKVSRFNPDNHLKEISSLYQEILNKKNRR